MKLTVCIGSSCYIKGSQSVVERLRELIAENKLENDIDLCGSFCMGRCRQGVCVTINDDTFSVSPESTEKFFEDEVKPRSG